MYQFDYQSYLSFVSSYQIEASIDVVSSIIIMHIETQSGISTGQDEQEQISFADLYNLYEIIGKFVEKYYSLIIDTIDVFSFFFLQRTVQCCSSLYQ